MASNEPSIAMAACVLTGMMGGTMLFGFLMAWNKGNNLPGGKDPEEIWRETKGIRFVVPLGILLCAISGLIYRYFVG